jgi:hypothetical protein
MNAMIAEADMSADRLKILEIQKKWVELRLLSREEAKATLDGEWLEAYNRFFEKYDDDMTRMEEIADNLSKVAPPIAKKTKGQKKRDKYAGVVELAAIRAANALPNVKKVEA